MASQNLSSTSPTIPSSFPSLIPSNLSSSTISPTISPTDQLTAMMIAFSCIVIFIVLVLLGTLIYRKDPFGCKSRSYQDSHADLEASSQQYSSRQTLVGSPSTGFENFDDINHQSGQLFCVGVASTYCLPPMGSSLPHLPSYESVRKKDRQRQIHMMIADRFGLNEPGPAESPPTYEESVRHSLQELQPPAPPSDAIPPPPPPPPPPSVRPHDILSPPINDLPQYEDLPYNTTSPESNDEPYSVDSDQ